jgi:catechol 2,3-dioxygenase-like lactoylglutathione lyase family enzyme
MAHAQAVAQSSAPGTGQPSSASEPASLPVHTTGLEHVSLWVPDVAKAGEFYGRVFNPELHKEKELPLRYYVPLGVGYIAIGAKFDARTQKDRPVQIDHYCALVEGYNPAAMGELLKTIGLPPGRFGMIPDPDGTQLQLLGVPGGLAKSTEPAGRIVPEDPLLRPVGVDHVVVNVSDLETALPFYRLFFGQESAKTADQAWFQVANTRLGLSKAPAGESPRVAYFCVNVARFDRKSIAQKLQQLQAEVLPSSNDAGGHLRFKDPVGITVEVKPV